MANKSDKNTPKGEAISHPFGRLPYIPSIVPQPNAGRVPDETACFELWDKYEMLDNVRRHSLLVAKIATALANRAAELGMADITAATLAAGMLHDLGKTYTLRYKGDHAMLGAAWTVRETGNYAIAQGVMLHVHWPWALPQGDAICCLPIFVLYADKRVRHDKCVTLEERFDDLLFRYGKTGAARAGINNSHAQAKIIERALSERLNWSLHENTFGCGGLVN